MSRKTQHNRGRGGNAAHDEDDDRQAAVAAATDQAHSTIFTTRLHNIMDHLPMFQSEKSDLVMVTEESWHIILLNTNYYNEEVCHFLFSTFCSRFLFLFEAHIMRGLEPVFNFFHVGLNESVKLIEHENKYICSPLLNILYQLNTTIARCITR